MKTPRELLKEALEKTGVTPTQLGVRLGYKNPYPAVYALLAGQRKFTREKQVKVADALGLRHDYFEAPDRTRDLEQYLQKTFQAFLATDVGARQTEEDRRLIERMGRQFTGDKLPTVAFFTQMALALEGNYTQKQLDEALKENEALQAYNDERPGVLPARIVSKPTRK